MGESAGKYVWLSPVRPLFHRCGGPPSPMGKVKDFSASLIKRGKTWLYSASEVLKNAQ